MEQAIGYVGVSTEEQFKEGVSLVAQQKLIRSYASMRGLELIHIYVEQGVSGKIPLRVRLEGAEAGPGNQ